MTQLAIRSTARLSSRAMRCILLAVVTTTLGACGCGHGSGPTGALAGRKGLMRVQMVEQAAGATRLLRSPSGRFVVAELAGDWTREMFGDRADEVPPILFVIDTTTGERVATVNGWALGPPTDDGDLAYIEEHEQEYQYRVRSLTRPDLIASLEPPGDGVYAVRGTVRAGDRLVAVLWTATPTGDAEQLWVASIDPTSLATVATATYAARMPLRWDFRRLGAGLAATDAPASLYLLEYPTEGKRWHVTSLDARSLTQRWRTPFEGTSEYVGTETTGRNAIITASGDGTEVAVVYGPERGGRVVPETVHVVGAASGQLARSLEVPVAAATDVIHAAPVPGRAAIALLHVVATRHDPAFFNGVTLLGLADGAIIDHFEVSRATVGDRLDDVRAQRPGALAVTPGLEAWVAPRSDPQPSNLASLVTTPTAWHRDDRPRVRARDEALGRRPPSSD